MRTVFTTYIVSFMLMLAASAVVMSTVIPMSERSEMTSLLDCESDSESESENEPAKEDDGKEQFARWHHHAEVEVLVLHTRLTHGDHSTRNVHLDIFTPPPEV